MVNGHRPPPLFFPYVSRLWNRHDDLRLWDIPLSRGTGDDFDGSVERHDACRTAAPSWQPSSVA